MNCYLLGARDCQGYDYAVLNPPDWMETDFALDHVIPSGFYIHFTCSRVGGIGALRRYNETEADDDLVDGRFGLFCSDGAFVARTWPSEDECVQVAECSNFPSPPEDKGYKSLSKDDFAQGEFMYFECQDPSAILEDNTGRNYFPLYCAGVDGVGYFSRPTAAELGNNTTSMTNQTEATNQTLTSTNQTMTTTNQTNDDVETFVPLENPNQYPKCRKLCKNFYVGRLDFKAVNDSLEVRSGDLAEFSCKEGYFIEGGIVPVSLDTGFL